MCPYSSFSIPNAIYMGIVFISLRNLTFFSENNYVLPRVAKRTFFLNLRCECLGSSRTNKSLLQLSQNSVDLYSFIFFCRCPQEGHSQTASRTSVIIWNIICGAPQHNVIDGDIKIVRYLLGESFKSVVVQLSIWRNVGQLWA